MSLCPRLITVSCFGTLLRRTASRGQQHREVLLNSLPPGTQVPSAAALSSSFKKAFREQTAAAPNFGKGKVESTRSWWNAVFRETLVGAGTPSLAAATLDDVCNQLYDNLHQQWEPFPTTKMALSNLRSWCDRHDCQLGVVANMDDRLSHLLHKLGLAENFDFLQSSYDCGFEQPAPQIYFNAVCHASVPPSLFASGKPPPALHCGHLALDDLHGALGAGFAACLVNAKFDTLSPLQQMITEWQATAETATRAWHSPHLGLTQQLLVE